MVDCMIAAVAYRRGAALLSWDVDMDRVAQVIGAELDEASSASPTGRAMPEGVQAW